LSDEEFQRHFSKLGATTDTKLISHKRIGYIGYKTNEDATKAVKYYNRTFIRMSRVSVELARSVGPHK
jgi:multiple RNA-binding domain-containing protein 1